MSELLQKFIVRIFIFTATLFLISACQLKADETAIGSNERKTKLFSVALGKVDDKKLAYSALSCDLMILSALSYPTPPPVIRKVNKKMVLLGYCEAMSTDKRYDDFDELDKHEDWFLHDKAGRRINVYIYKTDMRYGMDKTNGGYQDWLVRKCKKIVDSGYDGIFLDNVGVLLGYRNPFKYSGFPVGMDNDRWQKGTLKMLEKIKSAIGKDKILVFNQISIDDGLFSLIKRQSGLDAFSASIAFTEVADGAMKENFCDNGKKIDDSVFKLIDLLKTINKKNKFTLCLSRGNSEKNAKTLYCLYLLSLDGENAYFSYQANYKQITWFDFYRTDLGLPSEDYSITDGIGIRKYERGIVVVNCSKNGKYVKLPLEYKNKSGNKYKGIFLNGGEGEILFKDL